MKLSWRAVLCAVVMVGATGAFKACKTDGTTSGGEDPPKTVGDSFPVENASAAMSLNVLGNDTNLTNEPLTYTIEDSPTVGSASFNSDHTIALTVPSGFRGVTKFRYKITNNLGGFSISSVAVFVEVPAYRALYAAKSSSSVSDSYELYTSDFLTSTKISNAVTGNFRLQNMWLSKSGQLVVYERGDGSSTELFFVKPTASPSQTKLPLALGRKFVSGGPVAISDDSRWIAYVTDPTSASGAARNLYVLDTTNPGSAVAVGSSAGLDPVMTQWKGTGPTLYFVAPAGSSGHAVYRAGVGAFDAPQRVSPVYGSADQQAQVLVSPDESRILIVGRHSNQTGAFFVDPADPNTERRLTTDIPGTAALEAYRTDENVSRLVYLWRTMGSAVACLSEMDINADDTPETVFQGDVVGLADLRRDGATALITRGSGGAGSDGRLFEVTLDGSATQTEIASNVTGGVYADNDRVYLYSRTLTPSVIQRSDFERTPAALVRTSTPATALFVAPIFEPSAAILQDATSGLVLVNAAAPGKTLKLTDADSSLPATLYPTLIGPAQ